MNLRPSYFVSSLILISTLSAQANEWLFPTPTPSPTPNIVEEILENPYRQYYSQKDIQRISKEIEEERRKAPRMVKGQIISVDTRDSMACSRLQNDLLNSPGLKGSRDLSSLCRIDPQNPVSSIVILRPATEEEWRREISMGVMTSSEKNLYTHTRNISIAAVGVAGILYMMPESVSKWDKSKMKDLGKNWVDNVKAGPVIDKDDWVLNYVGHPYSGAAYYQVARHSGLTPMASFGYSIVMSTFFWEYGVESFAEVPSIQDLILTPLLGAILGEVFYRSEQRIRDNGGKVMGSKKLGSFLMVVMNPMGALSDKINKLFGSKVVQNARASWVYRPGEEEGFNGNPEVSPFWGLEIQFKH